MSVGKVSITSDNMLSNEAIAHMTLHKNSRISTEHFYSFLSDYKFITRFNFLNSYINKLCMIRKISIIVSSSEYIEEYSKMIVPIFCLRKNIEKANIRLNNVKTMLLIKISKDGHK